MLMGTRDLQKLFAYISACRHLPDSENNEFRRFHRAHSDLDNQLACVDNLWWIRLLIALHVEGLFRCCTKKGS